MLRDRVAATGSSLSVYKNTNGRIRIFPSTVSIVGLLGATASIYYAIRRIKTYTQCPAEKGNRKRTAAYVTVARSLASIYSLFEGFPITRGGRPCPRRSGRGECCHSGLDSLPSSVPRLPPSPLRLLSFESPSTRGKTRLVFAPNFYILASGGLFIFFYYTPVRFSSRHNL